MIQNNTTAKIGMWFKTTKAHAERKNFQLLYRSLMYFQRILSLVLSFSCCYSVKFF